MSTGRSASRRSLALTLALALAPGARAAPPAACPVALARCDDEACAVRVVHCALTAAPAADALAVARDARAAWPDSGRLQVLLGAAYLGADNPVWALRTLLGRVTAAPDDCDARVWLAWTRLRLDRDSAIAELLADPSCARPGTLGTRALLVAALAHHRAGAGAAAAADLARARRRDRVDLADAPALAALSRAAEPQRVRHLAWRLEAAAGYSSNPLLGAPTDPTAAAAAAGSAIVALDAWARLALDPAAPLRPVIELQPRTVRYLAAGAEGLSTLDLSGRLGLLWGRGFPRALLAWRPDYLLLSQGDAFATGPVWYYGAHRAEVEVEVSPALVAFGGVGWRGFRELGRSRLEGDLGAGGGVALDPAVALLWALTGRAHAATDKGYDLLGATAVFSLDVALPATLWARASGGAGADWYPRSEYAFGVAGVRRDVAVRAGLQLGVGLAPGVRVGLAYDLTWRDSTVPEYAASDHRATLRVTWAADRDVAGPDVVADEDLAPLGWGLTGAAGGAAERVQDLLRRDEQVRPGCGCGL